MTQPSVAPPTPGEFECSAHDWGREAAWVRLAGELDVATAPILRETLQASLPPASGPRLVVLDMRGLEFLDSSGVHAITEAELRAREAGGRLVLVRGPPAVDRVFTLSGRREQLEIVGLDPGEPPVMALLHLARGEDGAG